MALFYSRLFPKGSPVITAETAKTGFWQFWQLVATGLSEFQRED